MIRCRGLPLIVDMSCGNDGTARLKMAFMAFQVVSDYPGLDQYVVRQVARCWGMVPAKGEQGQRRRWRVTIIGRAYRQTRSHQNRPVPVNVSALHSDVIDSRPALQIFPATDGPASPSA